MKQSALAATAHHEAGHAFAAILRGMRFDHVAIETGDISSGHVRFLKPTHGVERMFHVQAIVAMAGEAAQRRFNPRSVRRHHGDGDREGVANYALENGGGSQKVVSLMVKLWEQQARELVENYWPQVQEIAAALLERRRLSEAECRAVLGQPRRA